MALLLGNVEQITFLRQKQLINWARYGVPDFLMSVSIPSQLVEGEKRLIQRFFVEVKTASDSNGRFLLPTSQFNKLTTYGLLYTLPVYFAVKMRYAGSFQWLLISSVALSKISKTVRAKVRGRVEDCLSSPVTDMLKEDLSGLWLSNYTVMIPVGFKVRSVFGPRKSSVSDVEYGNLQTMEITGPSNKRLVIQFHPGMDFQGLILQEVLRRMQLGQRAENETQGEVEVTYESGVNYGMPFFSLVADVYLDLREKFEPFLSGAPASKPTPTYFLEVFSNFDQNLASGIRSAIWKLHEEGLILPIKMVPERWLGFRVRDRGEGA